MGCPFPFFVESSFKFQFRIFEKSFIEHFKSEKHSISVSTVLPALPSSAPPLRYSDESTCYGYGGIFIVPWMTQIVRYRIKLYASLNFSRVNFQGLCAWLSHCFNFWRHYLI